MLIPIVPLLKVCITILTRNSVLLCFSSLLWTFLICWCWLSSYLSRVRKDALEEFTISIRLLRFFMLWFYSTCFTKYLLLELKCAYAVSTKTIKNYTTCGNKLLVKSLKRNMIMINQTVYGLVDGSWKY